MKSSFFTFLTLSLLLPTLSQGAGSVAANGKLGCQNIIDLEQYKGQTYLAFMQETVSPLLNEAATSGYILADSKQVQKALRKVSDKVATKAIKAAGGEEKLLEIAEQLDGQNANLYDLPQMVAGVAPRSDRYTLSTFFGLVSCGGAIIKYAPGNVAYNVHYGTGENKNDDRTGRSFGEGPTRQAEDASDKNYLTDLETFVTDYAPSMDAFYSTLVKALANSDTSGYPKIADFGQTLLTDFLAVYTAEQARNLMDGRITLHWDAALLEVTLLGSFHSGQETIALYYTDPTDQKMVFTSEVYNQASGCEDVKGSTRPARLYDYWQFSKNSDPTHCKRSGINITKKEFRTLGQAISDYERQHNPKIVEAVEKHFAESNTGGNVYQELSAFFIDPKAESALEETEVDGLAKDVVRFLKQVQKDANKISAELAE